jgi:hypothetical protein
MREELLNVARRMRSGVLFPLSPALSLREREKHFLRRSAFGGVSVLSLKSHRAAGSCSLSLRERVRVRGKSARAVRNVSKFRCR